VLRLGGDAPAHMTTAAPTVTKMNQNLALTWLEQASTLATGDPSGGTASDYDTDDGDAIKTFSFFGAKEVTGVGEVLRGFSVEKDFPLTVKKAQRFMIGLKISTGITDADTHGKVGIVFVVT